MDTLGGSTLITRLTSDINQVQNGLNMALRLFMRSPFIVLGSVVMAFTIDSRAALVFVATVPLLSLIVFGIMRLTSPRYKKTQGQLDRVLRLTRENLTGVRVVRAFGREEQEEQQFDQENQQLTRIQLACGTALRPDEPHDLCGGEPGGGGGAVCGRPAGGRRRPPQRRRLRPHQLHEPDPGGAGEAGQHHRPGEQGPGLRRAGPVGAGAGARDGLPRAGGGPGRGGGHRL